MRNEIEAVRQGAGAGAARGLARRRCRRAAVTRPLSGHTRIAAGRGCGTQVSAYGPA